jgi:hypothetical protein
VETLRAGGLGAHALSVEERRLSRLDVFVH